MGETQQASKVHAPALPPRRVSSQSRATGMFLRLFDFSPKLDYSQFIMKKKIFDLIDHNWSISAYWLNLFDFFLFT